MRNFITQLVDRYDAWLDRNRRIKRAKIARVFKKERGLISGQFLNRWKLVCGNPGRCAIGALLAALGVTDSDLSLRGEPSQREYGMLRKAYGLDHCDVQGIICRNDSTRGSDECPLPIETARICEVNKYVAALA